MIRKAVVRAYDAATHKADLQIVGSHPTLASGLRVATNIPAADVVPGRQATVLLLDPSNPDDALVLSIQGALPSAGGGDTGIFLLLAGRAGGQAPIGGTAASENLTLESTSHATKGEVQVVDGSPFGARNMYGNYVGQGGADIYSVLRIRNQMAAESVSTGKAGITIDPYWAPSADSKVFTGISGYAIVSNAGRTGTRAFGLDFVAAGIGGGAFAELVGCTVRPQKLGSTATTISTFEGYRADPVIGANTTITNYASFRSYAAGNSGMATAIGLSIADITLGTNKYLIEVGPSTPNLRVKAGTPGIPGGDYEESCVYMAMRNNGGVVTLRHLHNRPLGSVLATDRVFVAI